MDNKNQSSVSDREMQIGKIIYHVNQLTPFPISDENIIAWAKSIDELKPNLKLEDLKKAIDKLKLGEVDFNPHVGIQNIFNALRLVDRPMVY